MFHKLFLSLLLFFTGILSIKGQTGYADSIHHSSTNFTFGPKLQTGWYFIVDTSIYKRKHYKTDSSYFLDPVAIATAGDFKLLKIYKNQRGSFEMLIKLSVGATISWKNATRGWIGRKLAFILNDILIEADYVNGEITNGTSALIGNVYTEKELSKIKLNIEKEKTNL